MDDYGTVFFEAKNEDATLVCEIDGTTLRDKFYARSLKPKDLIEAFESNRRRIEATAAARLPRRVAEGLRPVLLHTDF